MSDAQPLSGAIIIPAHNEASVITRTLARLTPLGAAGIEIIVACNGCVDSTASVARTVPRVKVVELASASKPNALNAADLAVPSWPRLYLDADIEIEPAAIRAVFEVLRRGDILAARPTFRYDVTAGDRIVRSFYRARTRLPSTSNALWGAGVFALSRAGHARFGQFPLLTGDDLFVDQSFVAGEKAVVDTPPAIVRTPRSARALLRTLRRTYRGQAELAGGARTARTVRELVLSIRGPGSAIDAMVYATVVSLARLRRPTPSTSSVRRWERDDTSRS